MLKKKDLVKQFELVVQQEIIEHNKAVSASNLSINKQREELQKQIDKLQENHKLLLNEYQLVSRQFNHVNNLSTDMLNRIYKSESNQFKLNERNHKEIEIIDKSVETVKQNQSNLKSLYNCLSDQIDKTKKAIEELSKLHIYEINRLNIKFEKELRKQKEDLLSLPSEAQEVKKEFMEELSVHKIDNAGLLREIKVLKKTVFVNEKKIENLETLIERINNKLT